MEIFFDFFSFQDANVRFVALGCVLMAASSAIVGTFTFLKKKALVGDAVAHAILPGICISFLFTGQKDPVLLIIGAFLTGWLALFLVDWISDNSPLSRDTSIALVLSVMFGIGIMLLTLIQQNGNGYQSGLDQFLFGKAASMVGRDLWIFSGLSVLLLLSISLLYKELKIITFDPDFASIIGYPVKRIERVLTILTVLAIVSGIQAVGVVLMAAMLITPAAAARYWTDKLFIMLILAGFLGGISGLAGAFISYTAPGMPTGPWIVMIISFIALFSFLFAPKKGILYRQFYLRIIHRKIRDENVLKLFYQIGEALHDFYQERTIEQLLHRRSLESRQVQKAISSLVRQGYLVKTSKTYRLTEAGMLRGRRIVKIHRLWELYLTRYVEIAADHVHEDAESIEHLITPELEEKLEQLLKYPEKDPHQTVIPYE